MSPNGSQRLPEEPIGPKPLLDAALVSGQFPVRMTAEERAAAMASGRAFAEQLGENTPCLIIVGEFVPSGYSVDPAEEQVMKCLLRAFGYQEAQETSGRRINVLLDSPGGVLDSAFKIVRYLTWYASEIHVYVPRQAKSASTLVALGAKCIYMSPFGELGPLDMQIPDPRSPSALTSALDCFQSVDYVRKFGIETMSDALRRLGSDTHDEIAFVDLLDAASSFGIGAIRPLMERVRALDFGSWGRSLLIGQRYAKRILTDNVENLEDPKEVLEFSESADPGEQRLSVSGRQDRPAELADIFVYRYPHHFYPIDPREARKLGLKTEIMREEAYSKAIKLVDMCAGKSFIDLVGQERTVTVKDESGNGGIREEGGAKGGDGRQAYPEERVTGI